MRLQHRGGVFRMELRADVPALLGDFHDFHKVGRRVDAHALHARRLVFCLKGVVKFITMPVTFLNQKPPSIKGGVGGGSVRLIRFATFH